MKIVPKDKPILSNLNSYYIDILRLLEHCQGEIGTGGIFFASSSAQATVFFDQEEVLNGYFRDKDEELTGKAAVDRLVESGFEYNFTVNIYSIPIEEIYFWSSLPTAERLYKDLSTEFTDLEGLIKKMSAEKLTGFIDISIAEGDEGGLVFINGGEIVGGSFSWAHEESSSTKDNIDRLIERTKTSGGLFQVSRIPAVDNQDIDAAVNSAKPKHHALTMIEELMSIFETVVTAKKIKKADFNSLLRKKFIEKADQFSFLDPFAAEFEYRDRKVEFNGDAGDKELLTGIVTTLVELASDLDITEEYRTCLLPWQNKYANHLKSFEIAI